VVVLNGFGCSIGTTLYEAFLSSGWNIGWTLLPILVIGILEQDIGATAAMLNPVAYGSGHRQMEFSVTRMLLWTCNAIVHAIIIYVLGIAAFKNVITAKDGYAFPRSPTSICHHLIEVVH
jgi:phospholipid-translocating ATPase